MFKGHIPDPVYKVLPYLYALMGIAAMFGLDHVGGRISGLALLSAGGLAWSMRRRYRKLIQQVASGEDIDLSSLNIDQKNSGPLVQVQWQKSFECGQVDIDRQHRHLFGLANELVNTVTSNKPSGDVELLLDELIEHITEHFRTEEAVLARTKHPLSLDHQEIHRQLSAKADGLRAKLLDGSLVTSELVGFVVYDVITDHMTKADLKFAVSG
jgi:hemerythrin-like metal-binding protein